MSLWASTRLVCSSSGSVYRIAGGGWKRIALLHDTRRHTGTQSSEPLLSKPLPAAQQASRLHRDYEERKPPLTRQAASLLQRSTHAAAHHALPVASSLIAKAAGTPSTTDSATPAEGVKGRSSSRLPYLIAAPPARGGREVASSTGCAVEFPAAMLRGGELEHIRPAPSHPRASWRTSKRERRQLGQEGGVRVRDCAAAAAGCATGGWLVPLLGGCVPVSAACVSKLACQPQH